VKAVRIGVGILLAPSLLTGCGAAPARAPGPGAGTGDVSAEARAVVDAPDRTDEDRRIDVFRRPAELLTFLGVRPGMRVGLIVAGTGYTAELLARAVAPGGIVYAENPRALLAGGEKQWADRLARAAMRSVVRVDRELEDPLPAEATNLDLVVINLVYHETVRLGVDRDRMNRAIFSALRGGGSYAVLDHSARQGAGVEDAITLHRIDEATVRAEVEHAGFRLAGGASFLRNPSDMRDWNDAPGAAAAGHAPSDRFALLFVKP
jgi:predicted methyltransferase